MNTPHYDYSKCPREPNNHLTLVGIFLALLLVFAGVLVFAVTSAKADDPHHEQEVCTTIDLAQAIFECQAAARTCRHNITALTEVECSCQCPDTIVEPACARWKTRRRNGHEVKKCVRWVVPVLNLTDGPTVENPPFEVAP